MIDDEDPILQKWNDGAKIATDFDTGTDAYNYFTNATTTDDVLIRYLYPSIRIPGPGETPTQEYLSVAQYVDDSRPDWESGARDFANWDTDLANYYADLESEALSAQGYGRPQFA